MTAVNEILMPEKCLIKPELKVKPNVASLSPYSAEIFFVIYANVNFSANEELKKFFAKSKQGKIRVVKISIENGTLVIFELVFMRKCVSADLEFCVQNNSP